MNSFRLLAISPSCVESVNRSIYRLLAKQYQVDVHLIIPSDYGGRHSQNQAAGNEPFAITVLDSRGGIGRLLRLDGVSHVIRRNRPTHVLVEADPASMLIKDSVRPARAIGAELWALTAENLPRKYLRESVANLVKADFKAAAGGAITWCLWRAVLDRVDRVFVLSNDAVEAFCQLGFAGRITKIPLGFDPTLFFPHDPRRIAATRTRLGLHETTIAYFGRLVPEKGVHLLVEALANLKDLRWQFLLDKFELYKTDYGKQIERLVRTYGIEDRTVHFDAKHEDMPLYVNAADIVVLPSITTLKWKEQYGRVIPEAMACGKLVVGSNSGAIPELIADAGFIFSEGSVKQLSEVIRGILTSSETVIDALKMRAQERAYAVLTVERQAAIMAECLNNQNGSTYQQRAHTVTTRSGSKR